MPVMQAIVQATKNGAYGYLKRPYSVESVAKALDEARRVYLGEEVVEDISWQDKKKAA